MKNQSGQALIETLYAFPVSVLIFTMIFWSAASGWSLFWMEYQLQDAVICLSDSPSFRCKQKHEGLIKQGANFLQVTNFILEKRTDQLYGKISFSFPFLGRQNFNLEKTVPWPIKK